MPSNLLTADIMFPQLKEGQSTDEKFGVVTNYLYLLLEQLRYTMNNLGEENFNTAELEEIGLGISEPLVEQIVEVETGLSKRLTNTEGAVTSLWAEADNLGARMEDAEGEVTQLWAEAGSMGIQLSGIEGDVTTLYATTEGLQTRVESAEGSVSTLTQRADSIEIAVSNAEGDISDLTLRADSLQNYIEDVDGNVSVLTQRADSLQSYIEDVDGNVSLLEQTVDGFALSVTNGENSSVIKLTSDGTTISSQTIKFTGVVTFDDLSTSGSTTINGSNITTGTIKGRTIDGGTITGTTIAGSAFIATAMTSGASEGAVEMHFIDDSLNKGFDYLAGGIKLEYSGTASTDSTPRRMVIYTQDTAEGEFALKLISAGNASIEADGTVYIGGGTLTIVADNIEMFGTVKVNGTTIG